MAVGSTGGSKKTQRRLSIVSGKYARENLGRDVPLRF